MQLLSEGAGTGHGAHIGRDDHHILAAVTELLGVVIHEDGVAGQVVHGDVKEALDLVSVQVHGQHAVGTGGGDHVGHQLGGDGIAGLGLAVLTGIAEVGDDGGDTAGRGALERIDHDEQLHQIVVDGRAGGLDHEHIAAADGLIQGRKNLSIRESANLGLTQLGAHEPADLFCQLGIGIAGKYLDVFAVRNHTKRLLSVIFLYVCICYQRYAFSPEGRFTRSRKRGSSSSMVSWLYTGSHPDSSSAPETALVILSFQTSRSSRPGAM